MYNEMDDILEIKASFPGPLIRAPAMAGELLFSACPNHLHGWR